MQTKTESYVKVKPTTAESYKLILDALKFEGDLSRTDLSHRTGLRISSVCGRVNELMKSFKIVVSGKKWDIESDRNVQTLKIVKG